MLTDAAGKMVEVFDYQAVKGMNALLHEKVGELPPGVYLLKMSLGERVMTEKIVVK